MNESIQAGGLPPFTQDTYQQVLTLAGIEDAPPHMQDIRHIRVVEAAYQLGADVELKACCQWLLSKNTSKRFVMAFRDARRPKPLSLREQALAQLDVLHADLGAHGLGTNTDAIRRALEALPE